MELPDLSDLNEQQRQVVGHDTGPLLVVAGAGTGKTQVITRRMAYLISTGRAAPGEILALTFTEKAAREMADRLYDLIGWQSFQVAVMTFNAFGAELLGRFASHIGRSTRGGLLTSIQKTLLLMQRFDELQLNYYGPQVDTYAFLEGITHYIEKLQNAGIEPQRYAEYVRGLETDLGILHPSDLAEQKDLSAIYSLYERIKTETGTYDYHDQLALPLEILHERPNLAQRLSMQYRYVLVDEYQDTSPVQDALLRAFVPPTGNIMAVGDDDQAIYAFRGADIANILAFTDHFNSTASAALVQNYRSGQPILDAAYSLIRHNDPERLEVKLGLDKRLIAQTSQATVEFTPYATSADEQAEVAEAIVTRLAAGEVPGQLAVLARSNAMLKQYAKSLRARQIPFAISTEVNIFEQRELINLWYLLEWIGHRASDEAIAHVILGPFVGWSAAEYRSVVQRSRHDLTDAETVIRSLIDNGSEPAEQLIESLDLWRGWAAEHNISLLAYKLVFETHLSRDLQSKAETSDRALRVFEDLHLLLAQMQDYEVVATDLLLSGYLGTFPKPPQLEVSENFGDARGVKLLTIHASKGLEFDSVYLVGCTNSAWSLKSPSGLQLPTALNPSADLPPEHELRRLMYVAATRAKTNLYISCATESAGGQRQSISPLLSEILGPIDISTYEIDKSNTTSKMMQKLQRFYPLKADMPRDKLAFETTDGWVELAVGALDNYQRCPHEFYLQYVLGISQPFGPQLAFGTALHGAIQAYYEAKLRGETPTLVELSTRLDDVWSTRGYVSQALADAALAKAHETLASIYAREESLGRQVLGSELKITLEIPEAKLRLRGRIDAYFDTPDGVEIRDFKTGGKKDAEKLARDARDNFQLRTYALAYEAMTGQAPALVTLDYIVTGVEGSAALSSRILANHRDKLIKLAERIRSRDFAPAPASDYHQCPAVKYYGSEDGDDDNA